MNNKTNYLVGFNAMRFELKEIHFIKSSKSEIENKCNNAIQQYDFSDYNNGGYIKGWIERECLNNILYIASPNVINLPTDSANLFRNSESQIFNLKYLEKIEFDNINTSNVTDMSFMFFDLENITKLDLSMFDTSNVTDMEDMFGCCYKLQEIKLESFNTQKLTNMCEMFFECKSIEKLSLKHFDTTNVEDFELTFGYMENIKELDLSSFRTTGDICTTYIMFKDCNNLEKIDIRQFIFDNVLEDDYYSIKNNTLPKYYEMFRGIPSDARIYVKSNKDKEQVKIIGMGLIEDKNVIVKK